MKDTGLPSARGAERGDVIVQGVDTLALRLAAALRVLVRGGMVTNDDITPDGSLTLEFKAMKDVEAIDYEEAGSLAGSQV